MGQIRMYVTALAALLAPASVGVVTLHASPTCERFVRTHVTVPVRNRVSKATAIAWERWRVGHPNWKPNPKVKRPRYRMTQRESLDKVAFACEVPTDPKHLDIMFPLAEVVPPMPEETMPPSDVVETSDVSVPYAIPPVTPPGPPVADVTYPPSLFLAPPFVPPLFGVPQLPPVGSRPNVPPVVTGVPPVTGTSVPPVTGTSVPPVDVPPVVVPPVVVPIAPAPEPSSLILTGLGMGSAGWMALRARRSRTASV